MDDISPYTIFIAIISFILLFIFLYIISIIIYPKKPIDYIKKKLKLNPNTNEPFEDATFYEPYEYIRKNYYLYYLEKSNNSTIIIDLPGGAFITSANTLKPYLYINQPHTVISIEYPVLPDGSMNYTLNYIYEVIDYLLKKYSNPKIILVGASAGCFYATKIINSEKYKDNIIKFIATSGYFGYKTLENLATYIGDKVYLRKLNGSTLNDCAPITPTIDTFFAVGADDLLKQSTINYLQQSGNANSIIEYEQSDHCFYMKYNNSITQKYYEDVGSFIKN